MRQASPSMSIRASHRFALRRAITLLPGRLASLLRAWRQRARQRRELRELDDATLRDVGMSRSQASFLADQDRWRE